MTNTQWIIIGIVVVVLIAVIGIVAYQNQKTKQQQLRDQQIAALSQGINTYSQSNKSWLENIFGGLTGILNSQGGKSFSSALPLIL